MADRSDLINQLQLRWEQGSLRRPNMRNQGLIRRLEHSTAME